MEPAELVNMLVADVLAISPAAATVFVKRGMGCPGCPFARFETIAEAAGAYGFSPGDLADALAIALRSPLDGDCSTHDTGTSR